MRKKVLILFPIVLILFLMLPGTAHAAANLNRLSGNDRYETAYQIAKAGWQKSDYAILAYGENYPDALAAVPLAKKLNAPILLTNNDSLNSKTQTALQEFGVKTVYLIGGTGVIPTKEEDALTSAGYTVKRLAGQDRYETAIMIAQELGSRGEVAVTTGDDYADALSIGPIAAEKQMPVILVPKDNLTSSIQDYLNSTTITKAYVVGSQDAISDNVASKFTNYERITGQDKYTRNIAVLNRFSIQYKHDKLYLATGENFADALAGAVYAAENSGAVVLVKNDLPFATNNFLQSNKSSFSNLTVFGGEGVIPTSLVDGIENNAIQKIDYGTLDGKNYTNESLGLKLKVPDSWVIANQQTIDLLNRLGNKLLSGSDSNLKSNLDASSLNNVYLLYTSKYEIGTSTTFNPNFELAMSNISQFLWIKCAEDYLTASKLALTQTQVKFTFPKDIYTENVGGVDFSVLEMQMNVGGLTVNQKIYASLKGDNVVSFTLTYSTEDQLTELNQILSSVQFSKI